MCRKHWTPIVGGDEGDEIESDDDMGTEKLVALPVARAPHIEEVEARRSVIILSPSESK